jgi:hypothetical protein
MKTAATYRRVGISAVVPGPEVAFLSAALLLCALSCRSRDDLRDALPGSWAATWSLDSATAPAVGWASMTGRIRFHPDGAAEVTAYGYDGCALAADTLHHRLIWRLKGNLLSFSDSSAVPGLEYRVLRRDGPELELLLLDEIRLRLVKQ